MKNTTWIKIMVSCGGLLVLLARLIWPTIKIDAISLGLIIVAILPWLSSLIESAEFPGGWKIKFRDIQRAGEKIGRSMSPIGAWRRAAPEQARIRLRRQPVRPTWKPVYAAHDALTSGGGYLGTLDLRSPVDLIAKGEL